MTKASDKKAKHSKGPAKPKPAAVVMLQNNWPGNFRRSVFKTVVNDQVIDTKTNKPIETKELIEQLEFTPGVPKELTEEQLEAVRTDIGTALVPVEYDEKGKPRVAAGELSEAMGAEETIRELEVENDELADMVEKLSEQLKDRGIEPCVKLADPDLPDDSGDVSK